MAQAKTISESMTIKLLDGTEVTLRPLSIRILKEFMAEFEKISTLSAKQTGDNPGNDFMDILVNCSAIALKGQLPEQTKFLDADEDDEEALETRYTFEDMIDVNIVNKVNEICGGISFDDKSPNAAAATREDGTA